jgi:hypothetical protein
MKIINIFHKFYPPKLNLNLSTLDKRSIARMSSSASQNKYSFLQLRFIQNPAKTAGSSDHLVEIKRNGDDYLWFYSDQHPRGQATWMTKGQVFVALDNLRGLLRYDCDAYDSMQVFAPGFPTVLIPLKFRKNPLVAFATEVQERQHWDNVERAFTSLKALMESVFEHWPENVTREDVREKMDPDDIYDDIEEEDEEEEDEDEEMEENDEDEYADMPPLVGLNDNAYDFKACDGKTYEFKFPSQPCQADLDAAKSLCCCYNSPQQTKTTLSNPPKLVRKVKNEVVDLTDDVPAMCTRSKRSQVCKNLSEGSYFN